MQEEEIQADPSKIAELQKANYQIGSITQLTTTGTSGATPDEFDSITAGPSCDPKKLESCESCQ